MQSNCLEASKYSELFWNEWKLNPENLGYNTNLGYKIEGNLDVVKLINCFSIFINSNALYRSYFLKNDNDGILYQYFSNAIANVVSYYDFFASKQEETLINNYINNVISHKFDLTKPPLFKITLFKTDANKYILIVIFHHIISDGVSVKNFIDTISNLYNNNIVLTDNYFEKFKSYMEYEHSILKEKTNEGLSYWTELLKDTVNSFDFAHFHNNQANSHNQPNHYRFKIKHLLLSKMNDFSSKRKVSLFNIFSAVWSILLHRYFDNDDIVITYPVNARNPQFSDLSGSFVNVIPLRIKIKPIDDFNSILNSLIQQRRNSRKFQNIPFQNIYPKISTINGVKKITSSLSDTIYYCLLKFKLNHTAIEPILLPSGALSDLGLEFSNERLFQINFNPKHFDIDFIKEMAKRFSFILSRCIDAPFENIDSYSLLSHKEYQKIIYDWNDTEVSYSKDKTIHQLFEEQVEKTPDNIAVIFENKRVTYRELNERTNQLAYLIRDIYKKDFGVEIEPDNLIGIYIERSLEMVIGILGILKAGGLMCRLEQVSLDTG